MDEVGNNSLQTNIIKRENVTATYDCHTYQLTPDSPIPISQTQTHIQAQVQNQGGTIVSHPIPTDYSSKYWVKDTPVPQKLLISSGGESIIQLNTLYGDKSKRYSTYCRVRLTVSLVLVY